MLVVRFTLEDKKFLAKWFKRPLGPNLKALRKYIDVDLYGQLVAFNQIYTQAKHNFNHQEDKSVFDYKDAIYVVFITREFLNRLSPLSEHAQDYLNQGKTGYRYDPAK